MPNLSAGPAPPPAGPHPLTGFDAVAWCYDALAGAVFGPALKKAQRAALAGLPPGALRVLILGGGTGWVLTEVLKLRPEATVLYLEASTKMLARAQARLSAEMPQAATRVEFRHGTQAMLRHEERFEAIITFFVLDCIATAEIEPALAQLRAALQPRGAWLLADFRPARRGWRWLLLRLMYGFFRLTTGLRARELPDLHSALAGWGLHPVNTATYFGGAIEATVFREA